MKTTKTILITLITMLAVTALIFQSCKKDEEQTNHSPQIENITSTPNTSSSNRLPEGEQVTISVIATDVDKDNLYYLWEADGGNFDGQANQSYVTWTAPMNPELEQYNIITTVSDGAKTTSDSIIIYVDKEIIITTAKIKGFVYYSSTTIPVSGVMVSVNDKSSTTGTDGYYEIIDAQQGNQTLTATKDGYDNYSTSIEITSETNDYNIEVTSTLYTHNLFGTVTNELTGVPISYVNVVVLNPDGTESNLKTQTSSFGSYQILTVPQGEHTITFAHDEYDVSEINILITNSDYELDLQMSTYLPVVITGNSEIINYFHVNISGNILSLGYSNISQHGHCWSIYPNPTTDDNKTELGSTYEIGYYTSEMINLSENTQYYVRCYVESSLGTGYGNQIVFTTPDKFSTITDPRDGQIYTTVDIGYQTWFAENLNYETTNSWWYDNSSTNGDIYGRLYNWEAALTACPSGWSLPSDDDWTTLSDFLGGVSIAGRKMKSTSGWNNNGNGTNSSGFNALPGGSCLSDGNFLFLGEQGNWWSSSEMSDPVAWYRKLIVMNGILHRPGTGKVNGFSVRCLKN